MKQDAPPELVKLTGRRGMGDAAFARMMELLAGRREGLVATDDLLGAYAESVEESLFASDDLRPPDCRECGACCSYFHQVPVLMTDPTPRMLTWKVWEAGDRSGPGLLWLRREPEAGRCIALSGRVGASALCAIYELRPASCREFEAGSDRCRAVRRLYGLEPRLPERELRRYEDRAEESLEDGDSEIADEKETLKLLEEAIDFNKEKLGDILVEAKRLLDFFDERGLARGSARCRRILEATGADASTVADERVRLVVPADLEMLEPWQAEELSRDMLNLGIISHEALERASRRLADLGRFAFEASGMQDRMEPCLTDSCTKT